MSILFFNGSEDDDEVLNREPPSEKERKNMVIVVSCVGLLITILAATMVGLTLGLSHLFDDPDVFSGIWLSMYSNPGFLSSSIDEALILFIVGGFNKLVG